MSVHARVKPPAGGITNFVLIIFWASYVVYLYNIHWLLHIQCLSLSGYICPMPVTIGVYLSNACHYRRIFVQCLHYRRIFVQCLSLSLSAYICPLPVTIGVYLSIACHYRRRFVHCLSLSAYICPWPRLKYYWRARLGGPQL